MKVDAAQAFPTFTTSRPRTSRGHRPAGLSACDEETVRRWEQDKHRFPPYQYLPRHCPQNRKGEYRLPSIQEREYMMGLPVGYTQMCFPKSQRRKEEYLVGNAWSVPVVTWLIGQLLGPRGFCPALSPAEVLDRLDVEGNPYIQSRLMRPPLRLDLHPDETSEQRLVQQLGRLVSTKGSHEI